MTPQQMRMYRKTIGWNQQQLADELGMNRKTVNGMECGREPIERRTELAVLWIAATHGLVEAKP